MKKIKLYIAISLNGKIANIDGSVEWLESIPNPKKSDYGYEEFYKSIDTTIQGNSTYNQIIGWGIDFPYAGKNNYVLTKNQELENTDYVEFVSENHIEFIKQLKNQNGLDIWLIGGGKVNTMLLNEGLIDEIQVFVMPIVLSGGIEIFEAFPNQTPIKLVETITHSSGVIELKYIVEN